MSVPCLHVPEIESRYVGGHYGSPPEQPLPRVSTCLDLLEIYPPENTGSDTGRLNRVVYNPALGHEDVVEHFQKGLGQRSSPPRLRILFLRNHVLPPVPESLKGPHSYEDVNVALHEDTAAFLSRQSSLGVSRAFWAVLLWKTWILKTGNCALRKMVRDGTGKISNVIEGWYRYSCGFKGNPSHVWFSYSANSATYIINNCIQSGVQDKILSFALDGNDHAIDSLLRPLCVDGFIAEAASHAWGAELLQPRMTLVAYEQIELSKRLVAPTESISELHQLSSNLHIVKEDMMDQSERLSFLLDLHTTILNLFPHLGDFLNTPTASIAQSPVDNGAASTHGELDVLVPVSATLDFTRSKLNIRMRWAQNYVERVGIQINLYYSLTTQKDNRTNLQIAEFTSRIATETQKDSSSMITMAAMTMLFLPGTFVSAIFSMVFFDTSSNSTFGLSVSPGAWLFPAVTIPLTALVFASWHLWQLQRNKAYVQSLEQEQEGRADAASTTNAGTCEETGVQWQGPDLSQARLEKRDRSVSCGMHDVRGGCISTSQSASKIDPRSLAHPIKQHSRASADQHSVCMAGSDRSSYDYQGHHQDASFEKSKNYEETKEILRRSSSAKSIIDSGRRASACGRIEERQTSSPLSWEEHHASTDCITSRPPRSYESRSDVHLNIKRRATESTLVQLLPDTGASAASANVAASDQVQSLEPTTAVYHPEMQGNGRTVEQHIPFIDQTPPITWSCH